MAKVAFLGLGVMGYPMAGHLKKKGGHDTTVYNRSAAKAQQWVQEYGGRSASTPREAAAGAEFVLMCVGNDNDIRSVVYGEQGALAGMKAGSILVDHTTASADIARELHTKSKAAGIGFVDAPVSGGQAGAVNGQLGIMCGGDDDVFARAKPVLDIYAKSCVQIGGPGAGQLCKMVNQIAIAGLLQGLGGGPQLRQEGRAGSREGDLGDLQRRGPVLADGESLEGDQRGQVRWLRLRRGLDAQRSRHLPAGGQPQRRAPACDCIDRSVLRAGAGAGRRALGYLVSGALARQGLNPAAPAGDGAGRAADRPRGRSDRRLRRHRLGDLPSVRTGRCDGCLHLPERTRGGAAAAA